MAIRRGRAWGNALGGHKRQRRDSKGRFASGRTGSVAKRTASKAKSAGSKAKKKYKNRGGKTATNVRNAKRRKYNKADLNKQLQRNHRITIAANMAGVYGGAAAGAAAGNVVGGVMGSMVGRNAGMVGGQVAAGRLLAKTNTLVTDRDFNKASKADQAAMARRIARAQKAHLTIGVGMAAYTTHQMMSAAHPTGGNTYGLLAQSVREARAKGGPRVARPGRFGANKGVYNVSTAGRKVPRSGGRNGWVTTPDGQRVPYRGPSRTTRAAWNFMGMV